MHYLRTADRLKAAMALKKILKSVGLRIKVDPNDLSLFERKLIRNETTSGLFGGAEALFPFAF